MLSPGPMQEVMLTTWALMLARARARLGTLLAIVATVAVLVLGVSAVIGAIGSAVRAAVVAAVDAAPDEDATAILTIPASSDAQAQTDAAAALFARLFGDSLRVEELPPTDGGALRWQLTVDPDGLDPWGVPAVAADLDRLDLEARAVDGLAPQGASVDGGLAATLTAAAEGVTAVQTVIPVPLALIAIGGVIATLQLARLLGDSRGGEATLLRARGLLPSAARRAAIVELIALTAIGGVLGWVASAGLVALLGSGFAAALRATWVVPLAATIVLGPLAGLAAHRAAEAGSVERGGRARAAVTGLSAVLLTLAAGFFVWQLRGLAGAATGDVWALVVTAVAPALALAAASILVLTLFAPVARLIARVAASRTALLPVLPARMVARHLGAFGVVVALIALAAGGSVLAGASIATWSVVSEESADLRAGADARAVVGSERVTSADVASVADAADAAAVLTHAGAVSDIDVSIVALPDEAIAAVVAPLAAAGVDPAAIAVELAHEPVGAPLPDDADRIAATFGVQGSPVRTFTFPEDGGEPTFEDRIELPTADLLEGEAWLVDALGTPAQVPLTITITPDVPFQGAGTLDAEGALPAGRAPWMLIGTRVGFRNSAGSLAPALTPLTLATGAGDVAWPSTAPIPLSRDSDAALITFAPVPDAVPAVVSAGLAAAFDLELGDGYDLKFERSSRVVRMQVAGFVDAVPGATRDAAVLLPLDAVTQSLFASTGSALRGDQVWASGTDAASALSAVFGAQAVDSGAANTQLTDSLAATWWVATSIGGLLAAVAVIAAAAALGRRRAGDVFVLRALGVTPRSQSRSRVAELAWVAGGAAVAGAALGAVVAVLALPALTLAAVPGVPAVLAETVVWGWPPPAVFVLFVCAAVVAAGALLSRLIAAQGRAGRVREAS
ncbi:MAG: hypothetical protein ABWY03_06340 [Microbacterium sp.]